MGTRQALTYPSLIKLGRGVECPRQPYNDFSLLETAVLADRRKEDPEACSLANDKELLSS
jgi:hypothetical protein